MTGFEPIPLCALIIDQYLGLVMWYALHVWSNVSLLIVPSHRTHSPWIWYHKRLLTLHNNYANLKKSTRLDKTSHVTCYIQSDCFISVLMHKFCLWHWVLLRWPWSEKFISTAFMSWWVENCETRCSKKRKEWFGTMSQRNLNSNEDYSALLWWYFDVYFWVFW